jgi:Family of unknown function (DUF6071)
VFEAGRIKVLVTNGCSCTAGEELRDPETSAWPHVLARRLGVPCVNLAAGGASNRRIVRTTVSGMVSHTDLRSVRNDEILFVAAWTELSRTERYRSRSERRSRRARRADSGGDGWTPIGSWLAERGDRASRTFYRDLYEPAGQEIAFLTDWILLDSFLTQRGVQRLYAFAFPYRPSGIALPLTRTLADLPLLGHFPSDRGDSCLSFLRGAAHLPKGPEGHPLEAGHEWFATTLFERMCHDE